MSTAMPEGICCERRWWRYWRRVKFSTEKTLYWGDRFLKLYWCISTNFRFFANLKKNPYFRSLFPRISMYFLVLQSPHDLLSSTHTINIESATHVPYMHTFALVSRLAPLCTAPFGAVWCGIDPCILKCAPSSIRRCHVVLVSSAWHSGTKNS